MGSDAEVRRVARGVYWREADARLMVEAWRRGGETLTGFASRHGVDPRRLARWAARLKLSASSGVRFHPVKVAGADRSRDGCVIEIELAGGRRVRVSRGFEVEDLRRVVAVLEETRC